MTLSYLLLHFPYLDGFAAPVSYIVPRHATDLQGANSNLSMTGEAVQLIGWGLGGLLFATIGLLPTTCINLVLYIISSFLMLFLPNAEVEVLESETNLEILLKGWKLVARNPRLRLLYQQIYWKFFQIRFGFLPLYLFL